MRRLRQVLIALLLLEFWLTVGFTYAVPCPEAVMPTWKVRATVVEIEEISFETYQVTLWTDGRCKLMVIWHTLARPYHGMRLSVSGETDNDGTIRIMEYHKLEEA